MLVVTALLFAGRVAGRFAGTRVAGGCGLAVAAVGAASVTAGSLACSTGVGTGWTCSCETNRGAAVFAGAGTGVVASNGFVAGTGSTGFVKITGAVAAGAGDAETSCAATPVEPSARIAAIATGAQRAEMIVLCIVRQKRTARLTGSCNPPFREGYAADSYYFCTVSLRPEPRQLRRNDGPLVANSCLLG